MPFEMKQLTINLSNEQYEAIKKEADLANKELLSFVTDRVLKGILLKPTLNSLDINE